MPKIGNITVSVLREESASTGNLIEALCAAHPEFPPIPMDQVGRREDGEEYRYASIASIRRAVMPALTRHGIWMHHVYGENESGEYVVTMLRHKTGEYITSTLRIPYISDVQAHKANRTLLCRTGIEGLLSVATEEDTDGSNEQSEEQSDAPAVDAATKERWRNNLALAEAAVAMALDEATLTRYVNVAKQRVASGDMPPDAVARIQKLCDDRLDTISKEKTRAGSEGTAGSEGPDAAGGGSGEQDRKRAKRVAGTGA